MIHKTINMLSHNRSFNAAFVWLLMAALTGCGTLTAPHYQAKVSNTQTLMQMGKASVGIGNFTPGDDKTAKVESLHLRAYSFKSPYQEGSFVEYLREATRAELQSAGIYDATSTLKIDGQLQANTVNVSSSSTGTATAQARFVLREQDTVYYDKVLRAEHTWESSFIGAVAIPAGAQNYGAMIQKLLGTLFSDQDFRQGIDRSRK